eukprot:TRINITY_DN33896_c0_g1_i1.p1 TRINITY_DN33896_c0_g1~~TRINITY_DN33896_c0_g1_i1.p1  ORF type:complete len:273 (+),score=33.15 TRINITY_DN33896_c0_g1_i1:78-896(+)
MSEKAKLTAEECVEAVPLLKKLFGTGILKLNDAKYFPKISMEEAGRARGDGFEGNMPSDAYRFGLATPLTKGAQDSDLGEKVVYHGTPSYEKLEQILTGNEGLKNGSIGWKAGVPKVVCTSRSFWLSLFHYGAHFDHNGYLYACVLEVRAKQDKVKIFHNQTIPRAFWKTPALDEYWVRRDASPTSDLDCIEWWLDEKDIQVTALYVRRVKPSNPALVCLREDTTYTWRHDRGDPSSTSPKPVDPPWRATTPGHRMSPFLYNARRRMSSHNE